MASTYSKILRYPGALKFSAAGLLARLPMSMMGISTILAVQELYGSYAAAGRVGAAGIVAAAIAAPILSRKVDTHGQAKVMLPAVIGSALSLAGMIFAATARAPEAFLMLLTALAGGLSGSMGSLVRARWTAILEKPEEVHTAFSLEAALDEVVFILGPILATVLCTVNFLPVTSGWAASLFFQVAGSIWFLLQSETEPPVREQSREASDSSETSSSGDLQKPQHVLRYSAVTVVVLIFMFHGALFGANDVAVVAFSEEQGMKSAAGTIMAFLATGSLIAALIFGSRPWPWPLWKQLLLGVIMMAVGSSAFSFAPNIAVLCVFMLVMGMAIAPTLTTGNNIVQAVIPPEKLTEGLAWLGTSMNVGVSLGSLFAGMLVDHTNARGGFIMVAGFAWLAVLMGVLFIHQIRAAKPRSQQAGLPTD